MPMTQTQLADAVADKAGLSRADAKKALAALEEVVLDEIGNAEKIKIGGVVQLDVRVRPATDARPGRNPATGEEITISAKPASVAVKARPLAKAKNAAPPLSKVQNKLVARTRGRARASPGAACFTVRVRALAVAAAAAVLLVSGTASAGRVEASIADVRAVASTGSATRDVDDERRRRAAACRTAIGGTYLYTRARTHGGDARTRSSYPTSRRRRRTSSASTPPPDERLRRRPGASRPRPRRSSRASASRARTSPRRLALLPGAQLRAVRSDDRARARARREHVRAGAVHRLRAARRASRRPTCSATTTRAHGRRRLVSARRARRLGHHARADAAAAAGRVDRAAARAQRHAALLQRPGADQRPASIATTTSASPQHADVVGFDMYPIVKFCGRVPLLDVFRAQRELMTIYAPGKPTFQWIETSKMTGECPTLQITPQIVNAETWLAVAGGACGIGYFTNSWTGDALESLGLRRRASRQQLAATVARVQQLAPALCADVRRRRRPVERHRRGEQPHAERRALRARGQLQRPRRRRCRSASTRLPAGR